MRLSELNRREDAEALLRQTLEQGWSLQFGLDHRICRRALRGQQRWLIQPLLSFAYVSEVGAAPRRFMADSFRYTSRTMRVVPQWLLGTAISSKRGLALFGRDAFGVSPPLEGARNLIVYTGNQRIYVFDFNRGVARAMLKVGFPSAAMRREIGLRAGDEDGPFPRITRFDGDARWYEEPLLDGYSLARCPPWRPASRVVSEAFEKLDQWLERWETKADAGEYVESVRDDILALLSDAPPLLRGHVGSRIEPWLDAVGRRARELGEVTLSRTHGDFQPGNIMLTRRGAEVKIIDWEHVGRRFRSYDAMVFGLRSRSPIGLGERLVEFVERARTAAPRWAIREGATRERRRRLAALFALEELRWYLSEATNGPFESLTPGFMASWEELASTTGPAWEVIGGA